MKNELTARQEEFLLESDMERVREIKEANHKAAEELRMKSLPNAQTLIKQVEEVERRGL